MTTSRYEITVRGVVPPCLLSGVGEVSAEVRPVRTVLRARLPQGPAALLVTLARLDVEVVALRRSRTV